MNISFQYGGATRFAQFGTAADRERYGWGDPGQLSGGQDLAREFQQQFQPGSALFAPNFPLVPVDPELARLWDFPVGYNYQYVPRSYEPVTFAELRALAYNENLTRMAIETRKDQIEKLNWQIKPRDEKNAAKDAGPRIKKLTTFWERPDGQRPFASWLREALEDVLVIDAPTFEILRNRDGSVRGYDIIDGSTIKVLIDITGRSPAAPAPAFQQVIHGRPWRLFTEDELLYTPRNKRPGHVYGFSNVEQVLLFINIALRRQQSQLYWFTDGNIPPGFMGIPELNAEQVGRFQQWLDSVLSGNLAERSKMPVFPYGAKYTGIKPPPLKDDFDEWLARVVMFCFSLPPDAFVRQRARATAETARQSALEEGLAPLMGWVKRLVDSEIQLRMGHEDLEFSWQDIKEVDPDTQSKVETMYAKLGIKTPDEVRDVMGLDPLPNGIGSQPYVIAGNQVLLVKDIEEASAKAVAPAPPPLLMHPPGAGPQEPGRAGSSPVPTPGGGGGTQQNGRGPGGASRAPGAQRQGARAPGPAATVRRPNGAAKSASSDARPLYVYRQLLNADALRAWARGQGFSSSLPPDGMHVTVAYSRRVVDWSAVGRDLAELLVPPSRDRTVASLGDEGATVLMFVSPRLEERWGKFIDAGASWDYDGYHPHVTISYDGAPAELSRVIPFGGALVFGPEIFEELDDGWRDDVDEIPLAARSHPRPGTDGARREALEREARQLLRRNRAARVEADLRAAGA